MQELYYRSEVCDFLYGRINLNHCLVKKRTGLTRIFPRDLRVWKINHTFRERGRQREKVNLR